jgi:hypothetical protein
MEFLRKARRGEGRTVAAEPPADESGSPTPPQPADLADVQVIFGASVQTLALAGLTVAAALPLVQTILRADPRTPVLLNGRPARATQVIARNDVIELIHQAGEKGRAG